MSAMVAGAVTSGFPGYDTPEYDILRRTGLMAPLRASIPGLAQWPRGQWASHPAYGGLASHWLGIHGNLQQHLDAVAGAFTALAHGQVPAEDVARLNTELRQVAQRTLDTAHHHHEIEDVHYFPQFLRVAPAIARPLSLLDADHRVLDASLTALGVALSAYPADDASPDRYVPFATQAQRLADVMRRHLADEEDIIMPTILVSG